MFEREKGEGRKEIGGQVSLVSRASELSRLAATALIDTADSRRLSGRAEKLPRYRALLSPARYERIEQRAIRTRQGR